MLWSALFVAGCLAIVYAGFCRLVHTSAATRWEVRASIALQTASAAAGAWAVLLRGYEPGWPPVLLVLSTVAVLAATSHAWREGVPRAYVKGQA